MTITINHIIITTNDSRGKSFASYLYYMSWLKDNSWRPFCLAHLLHLKVIKIGLLEATLFTKAHNITVKTYKVRFF